MDVAEAEVRPLLFDGYEQDVEVSYLTTTTWVEEFKQVVKLVIPLTISNGLSFLLTWCDLVFVGHIGSKELAAAALGNTWWNAQYYFIIGVASALDTLFSQSYGAGHLTAVGHWVIRGLVFLSILAVFMAALLGSAEPVMLYIFREDPELSALAGTFCIYLIPGLWFMILAQVLQKYMQVLGILTPCVIISFLANVLNIVGNYVLIGALGFKGSPIATSLTRLWQFGMTVAYLLYAKKRHSQTWPSFGCGNVAKVIGSRTESRLFFRLGMSGGMMLALEVWAFEACTLFASYLSTVELDAHTICLSFIALAFITLPLSLSIAATIRVGTMLGANAPAAAKRSAYMILGINVSIMAVVSVVMYVYRRHLGEVFSQDPDVIARVAQLAGVVLFSQMFDSVQGVVAGVLRGMGRQNLVALLNFVGFWVIGVALAVVLTFSPIGNHRVESIWYGLGTGLVVMGVMGSVVVARVDWTNEAQKAQQRVSASTAPRDEF